MIFDRTPRPERWEPHLAFQTELPVGDVVTGVGVTDGDLFIVHLEEDRFSVLLDGSPRPVDGDFGDVIVADRVNRSMLRNADLASGWRFDGASLLRGEDALGIARWQAPSGVEIWQGLVYDAKEDVDPAVRATVCLDADDHVFVASDGDYWVARQVGRTLMWGPIGAID